MRPCAATLALILASCAGAPAITVGGGSCGEAHDACNARCDRQTDARDCKMLCDWSARRCNARQGDGQIAFASDVRRQGDETAILVDLFGRKIQHSSAARIETRGAVVWKNGMHELAPGAGLSFEFELPAGLRHAEFGLTHAPGGKQAACFITVTVGDKTLVGRYAPPRLPNGRLKAEYWDLLPILPPPPDDPEAPYVVKMFIFNNSAAGSTEPYRLATIEVFYRPMQAPED